MEETSSQSEIKSSLDNGLVTLEQFIIERQQQFPHSTGSFSRLLRDISVAGSTCIRRVLIVPMGNFG